MAIDMWFLEKEEKLRQKELAFQERQRIYHEKLKRERECGNTSEISK